MIVPMRLSLSYTKMGLDRSRLNPKLCGDDCMTDLIIDIGMNYETNLKLKFDKKSGMFNKIKGLEDSLEMELPMDTPRPPAPCEDDDLLTNSP